MEHEQRDANPVSTEPRPLPIEGLLYFPAIGVILNPLMTSMELKHFFSALPPIEWNALKEAGAHVSLLLGTEIFTRSFSFGMSLFLVFAFFGRWRLLPGAFIFYWTAMLLLWIAVLALGSALPNAPKEAVAQTLSQLVYNLLMCIAWVPYFLYSKRVASTFVVDNPAWLDRINVLKTGVWVPSRSPTGSVRGGHDGAQQRPAERIEDPFRSVRRTHGTSSLWARTGLWLGVLAVALLGGAIYGVGHPWTYDQCTTWASNRPTELGAQIAYCKCADMKRADSEALENEATARDSARPRSETRGAPSDSSPRGNPSVDFGDLWVVIADSDGKSIDVDGWTQESSGERNVGPWLKFDAEGTRYCRTGDGYVHRLFPPGRRPGLKTANEACMHNSVIDPMDLPAPAR